MKVYRVCKENEMNSILLNNDYSSVGYYFKNTSINNHNYNEYNKYLHFFKNFEDIFYLNLKENYYICIYDIPSKILEKYESFGYYLDYFTFKNNISVIEYAIDIKDLEFNYLKKVYRIKKYIDIFDYTDGNIEEFVENIYDNEGIKHEKKLYKNE